MVRVEILTRACTFDITADSVCYNHECPRALVGSLGVLLLQKLLPTAFVGPVLVVVLNTRTVRKCKERLLCGWKTTTNQDTEVVGILVVLEIVLVPEFVVPLAPPVAAFAFAPYACTFEFGLKHQGLALRGGWLPQWHAFGFRWC